MAGEEAIVRAMADVSEAFLRIAGVLRRRADVRRVDCPWWLRAEERVDETHFRVGSGSGFRAEWYVEAEFVDGRLLVFEQEVAWHDGEWAIDAAARLTTDGQEQTLLRLPSVSGSEGSEATAGVKRQSELLEEQVNQVLRCVY